MKANVPYQFFGFTGCRNLVKCFLLFLSEIHENPLSQQGLTEGPSHLLFDVLLHSQM